jgi:spermidine/putrescine transport system permease protein
VARERQGVLAATGLDGRALGALTSARGLRLGLGLGPALTIIGAFLVLPLGIIAVYSFMEAYPYGGVRPHFTVDAYVQFLYTERLDGTLAFNLGYLEIFLRSLLLATSATALSLLVGFPAAYYIARQPPSRRNLFVLLVTIPFWTNLLIRTYTWILILRDQGLINNVLMSLGLVDEPLRLLYTPGAIIVGLVYSYLPFMVLPIYASIEKLDPGLIEAAHDLYAGRVQALRRVILPLSLPGIAAGCTLVFIPSLGTFVAPDLLGGAKNLMIGSLIQMQFSSSRNWPFGSATALILMALILLALALYALAAGRTSRGALYR